MSARTVALSEVIAEARPGFASGSDLKEGIAQIRMNNLTRDGKLDWSKIRRVEPPKKVNQLLLEPGDVLFNATNSPELVGKTAYFDGFDEPVTFSNHFLRLRSDNEKLDGRYLAHWMQKQFSSGRFSRMCKQWVNQATVSRDLLLSLTMPLPPLGEQRRIAAILDKAEELRAKRRAAIALLDQLPQAIFLEMFGDPVSNPKGWPNTSKLAAVSELVSGITKGRKVNGKAVREIPYLAVVNVQDRHLNLSAVKTIGATEDEIERYRLQPRDLLLTEGGDPDKLGRGSLWNGELPEAIHQNHIFRVRVTSPALTPLYLSWLIGSSYGKAYFLRQAKQTTGIATINMGQLKAFPLILPPIESQHQFALRVEAIQRAKSAHQAAIAALDSLFISLQDRVFSDNPASSREVAVL